MHPMALTVRSHMAVAGSVNAILNREGNVQWRMDVSGRVGSVRQVDSLTVWS